MTYYVKHDTISVQKYISFGKGLLFMSVKEDFQKMRKDAIERERAAEEKQKKMKEEMDKSFITDFIENWLIPEFKALLEDKKVEKCVVYLMWDPKTEEIDQLIMGKREEIIKKLFLSMNNTAIGDLEKLAKDYGIICKSGSYGNKRSLRFSLET